MRRHRRPPLAILPFVLAPLACGPSGDSTDAPGVDMENRVVRVGLLNDLSGPAAVIGRAINLGVKIRFAEASSGDRNLLPDGWRIEPLDRDHGYNPQQSVQAYNEIYDEVFFIGLSLGTPTTLPLQPMLARDHMIVIPASLSSRTGRNEYTPLITPSYRTEGMRAVDWAVARGGSGVRLGIVYNQDDFGMDALEGFEVEAAFHGVQVVSKQPIAPGQADFTAPVSALQSAGADYVLLGVLGGATSPIVGTARQLGYAPTWLGTTPSWLDQYFDPDVIPPEVLGSFHLVSSLPFWGEDRPGMSEFLDAFARYRQAGTERDWWILLGYVLGGVSVETLRRTLESGDVSREGMMTAMRTIDGWDMGGLTLPISLVDFPYVGGPETRVLRPVLSERTWEVVGDFAAPESGMLAPDAG